MSPTIHHSYQPVAPATLDVVEQRIGRPISAEYRAFLLEHNGGYPEPSDFEITHRNGRVERISMEWFFPVEIDGSLDLAKTLKTYHNRLPDEVFPFGCDPWRGLARHRHARRTRRPNLVLGSRGRGRRG